MANPGQIISSLAINASWGPILGLAAPPADNLFSVSARHNRLLACATLLLCDFLCQMVSSWVLATQAAKLAALASSFSDSRHVFLGGTAQAIHESRQTRCRNPSFPRPYLCDPSNGMFIYTC